MEDHSYEGDDGARQTIRINIPWDKAPRMPFYGWLGGFTTAWQKKVVAPRIVGAYFAAGRPLTDIETEAMTYWWAHAAALQGHQVPVVIASTLYFTLKGRATHRFPCYTPKPANFNPNVFPSKGMPLLTGNMANQLWLAARMSAYYAVTKFSAAIFFASWAVTSTSANISRDDRLKKWLRDVTENRKKQMSGTNIEGTGRVLPNPRDGPVTVEIAETSGGTGASQDWRAQDLEHSRAPDAEQTPTPPPITQRQTSWPRSQSQPAAPRPQSYQQYQPPTPVNDDPFDDDDASPVAPVARRQQAAPPAPGTAWNRVRQGQVPRPEGSAQAGSWAKARQGAGQNAQEEYSYSNADEEKGYAKSQAQKDFDAMLEKERQGKAENSNRRW